MSNNEAKKQASAEDRHRAIRDLSSKEFAFLRKLISSYPNFESLEPGDQLDRMVLVLQSACGYGAVSLEIVKQIQDQLSWGVDFGVEDHFRLAQYQSRESKSQQTRYRESFSGAFCLKREYLHLLSEEGERNEGEEPIRKKVKATAPVPPQVRSVSSAARQRAQTREMRSPQIAEQKGNLQESTLGTTTPNLADSPDPLSPSVPAGPEKELPVPLTSESSQTRSPGGTFRELKLWAALVMALILTGLILFLMNR